MTLKEAIVQLRKRKISATDRAEATSEAVNLGFVLEKLILGRDGFPHLPHDCRPLYEPIDYVAFDGLTEKIRIELIAFLDVKSGNAKLSASQKKIRQAIADGRVDYKEI